MEKQQEKKVEYLELIYDLIFVYIIGRNNSLLQNIENGFISGGVFLTYVLYTLAVIQIWNFSTFYINLYGRNSVRDHVFLFINMYLLYLMADGTRLDWQASVVKYSAAWALILINIGVQHLIEIRNRKNAPWEIKQLRHKALIVFIEAALVLANMLCFKLWGVNAGFVPILFGMAAMLVSGRKNALAPVDFAHLTERAMLYVVFTFGEMIIVIASYFKGGLTFNTFYFSAMAFLIVVGLFLGYGTLYNRSIDREMATDGTAYMLIHVFLIFALNNLSASLEFMRDEEVSLMPKTLFLVGSFVLYYAFLFLLGRYSKKRCAFDRRFVLMLVCIAASFVLLMLALREIMFLNIAVSVIYVFGIFLLLLRHGKSAEKQV